MTPIFLDTNILLYSISTAPDEATKRDQAIALLDREDVALSVQVLQEFYVQATRPTRPDALPHDIVVGLIRAWARFRVQEITLAVFSGALEIKAAHCLSYWDSAIVAAARALGCRKLYSEDMNHGQEIEGVTLINPFRRSP
jgi:predicted nucleic acid-binding protein